ncbi:MAG: hypothetical protein H0W41_01295 [Chloroflexi bacterium]|nr:hypothetical protein [Chloroflexota bacterium]
MGRRPASRRLGLGDHDRHLLTEGFRRSTLAAAIGTFGALALAAILAAIVAAWAS